MTNINYPLPSLLLGTLLYFGGSSAAMACGCGSSRTLTPSVNTDDPTLYVTATMVVNHLCQAEVTATITAPDSTTATGDSGVLYQSPISATAAYTLNQDGTYQDTGTYYYDGWDSGLGMGYYPPIQVQTPLKKIRAFYYLSGTGFLVNTFKRCNPNNACDTMFSKKTNAFVLLTVWQIQIGLGLTCSADPLTAVAQTACMSPDPIP
jgi:hypothetical protein